MEHKEEVDMETLWFGWVGLYCVVLDGLVPNVGRQQANSFDMVAVGELEGHGVVLGGSMVYGLWSMVWKWRVKGSF